jgi:hypothetical protein
MNRLTINYNQKIDVNSWSELVKNVCKLFALVIIAWKKVRSRALIKLCRTFAGCGTYRDPSNQTGIFLGTRIENFMWNSWNTLRWAFDEKFFGTTFYAWHKCQQTVAAAKKYLITLPYKWGVLFLPKIPLSDRRPFSCVPVKLPLYTDKGRRKRTDKSELFVVSPKSYRWINMVRSHVIYRYIWAWKLTRFFEVNMWAGSLRKFF